MEHSKNIFNSVIISLLIVVLPLALTFAQNPPPLPVPGVKYSYDLNGNRIMRESTWVLMKRGLEEDSAQVEATITAENKITLAPNPAFRFRGVGKAGGIAALAIDVEPLHGT